VDGMAPEGSDVCADRGADLGREAAIVPDGPLERRAQLRRTTAEIWESLSATGRAYRPDPVTEMAPATRQRPRA